MIRFDLLSLVFTFFDFFTRNSCERDVIEIHLMLCLGFRALDDCLYHQLILQRKC